MLQIALGEVDLKRKEPCPDLIESWFTRSGKSQDPTLRSCQKDESDSLN